jgi:hypothetical protein
VEDRDGLCDHQPEDHARLKIVFYSGTLRDEEPPFSGRPGGRAPPTRPPEVWHRNRGKVRGTSATATQDATPGSPARSPATSR